MAVDAKVPNQVSEKADDKQKSNVWRGAPHIWQRCITCEVHKKCAEAGVVRGSKACVDARYSMIKRSGEKGPF